jgi:hypothetical protein
MRNGAKLSNWTNTQEKIMKKYSYAVRLAGEFVQFSRQRKIYWLIPLMLILIPAALFIVAGEVAAPLIYTLF